MASRCIFQHNQKDNIEYGQHTCQGIIDSIIDGNAPQTCHRHILQKVNCLGVAEGKNQDDTETNCKFLSFSVFKPGGGHDEVSVEIPGVTELRSDQACKGSVKLSHIDS